MATNDIISTHFFDSIVNNIDHNELNIECQRWALAHGFVQRRFLNKDNNESCVIPYPFTIYPSPYPRHEYNKARQIQYTINAFIQRLAWNRNLMDTIFQRFIDCDPFIRRLRNIFNEIPCRSIAETCIIRTDYMLQSLNNIDIQQTKLRLTEMNTIAVGLGAAAKLMHAWHKRVLMRIRPELVSQLPENESSDLIIDTLFESWQIYNNSNAIILFIVPEREFNIGDQLLIEQGLLTRETQCLLVKHVTFMDICHYCSLNADGTLYFRNVEVALVYYRCAYDPQHFSSEDIWQAYIMLESSRAIKCPSLRYHLAGMKCFQLALVENRFLEEIFPNEKEYIDDLRQITEQMFTIDQATNDPILRQQILTQPESFYLKQSREGGNYPE